MKKVKKFDLLPEFILKNNNKKMEKFYNEHQYVKPNKTDESNNNTSSSNKEQNTTLCVFNMHGFQSINTHDKTTYLIQSLLNMINDYNIDLITLHEMYN